MTETKEDASAVRDLETGEPLLKRYKKSWSDTRELFLHNYGAPLPVDSASQSLKLSVKIADEYNAAKIAQPVPGKPSGKGRRDHLCSFGRTERRDDCLVDRQSARAKTRRDCACGVQGPRWRGQVSSFLFDCRCVHAPVPCRTKSLMSLDYPERKYEKPEWHAPWKLHRVIAGHLGWVHGLAVEPGNEWFASASADRTIKIWDLATGTLKLTLTGHINSVTCLQVSARSPYLFSAGLDKMVKCWDLEQNKVVRSYHGHLSGVYSMALHPTIDLLITGGRDSTARVWDIRTKAAVRVLAGHTHTVGDIVAQGSDPQIITGSHDNTVRLWDLTTGKATCILTHHKKSIRALALHPTEFTFCSAGADNLKVFKCPDGLFLRNLSGHNSIVNSLAVNRDGVLVSGGDNGSMYMWDWKTGYNFQQLQTIAQPGSLDSEHGIYKTVFDQTGSRLLTGEADKTIKVWREDETATQESHPINFKPPKKRKRY